MGNTISSSTPAFLLQSEHNQPHEDFSINTHSTTVSNPFKRHKPLQTKPDLAEPALEGYVAGWRQTDFDDDAQEFSFATFQQDNHGNNTTLSGYEGDDEEDDAAERDMKVRKEEFETLDRGRGLGRSGSYREREIEKKCEGGGSEGGAVRESDVRTWKERKWEEPSLERKLDRVRRTVADEHALPRGCGRDAVMVRS